MTRPRLFILPLVLFAVVSGAVSAEQLETAGALDQQIERIFKANEFALPRFGPARWLEDGTAYTIVERSAAGVPDIVRYDAATGARSILVPGSRLVSAAKPATPEPGKPADQPPALSIDDYAWSDDGSRLLVFTNTQKVWRQNTRGDYWVLHLKSGELKQLGAGAPASSLMFAKFSPDATRVGYVRGNNIYIERLDDGRVNILTQGTRPLRIVARQDQLPYPAAEVEFLIDREEEADPEALQAAHEAYSDLVQRVTDKPPDDADLETMGAYDMAATVEFGLDAKQGLLDLRSENARLKLVVRLLRAATTRLDFVDRAQARARSNDKVRFG